MKTYLTQNGCFVGPRIEAFDFGHAVQQASELGVVAIGEHILTISRKGFTEKDADAMCKAFSESEII